MTSFNVYKTIRLVEDGIYLDGIVTIYAISYIMFEIVEIFDGSYLEDCPNSCIS